MIRWGTHQKWIVAGTGTLIVVYCMLVLGYIATGTDLRLRCLLADERPVTDSSTGVKIQDTTGLICKGTRPETSDLLLRVGETEINSFLDFATALAILRTRPIPANGQLHRNSDPSELEGLPSLVDIGEGKRLVEIEFIQSKTRQLQRSWLQIQPLPMGEIILSFVWFLLQLGISVISLLAVWGRPFDRQSRLFYALCVVTLGAFVGGYHWWVIAANAWLNIPFVVCAVLLPVVLLHFFLTYPRPKPFLAAGQFWPIAAAYAVPAVTILVMLAILVACRILGTAELSDRTTTLRLLVLLQDIIFGYLVFAAVCFAGTLLAVAHGYFTTENLIEQGQMKWLLVAGVVAAFFVGYSLQLALFDRVGFALGRARIPMFLASLSFMLAYAVGIVRFKLMLVEQVISKGMVYYAASSGVTIAYGLTIAVVSVATGFLNMSFSRSQAVQQALFVTAILALVAILLLWLRDGFQQIIDRRFFREKYQLDRALQNLNRAVSRIGDQQSLAQHLVTSCRDFIGVRRAALYLRNRLQSTFELVATDDTEDLPSQIRAEADFLQALQQDSTLQRVTPSVRGQMSPSQNVLRLLQSDVVHALESDGEVAGVVALGAKKNNASYTAEDLTFLNALGQMTSVALHGLRVHQDVIRLNDELQLKVDRIAEQQRQIAVMQSELTGTVTTGTLTRNSDEPEVFQRESIKGNGPAIARVLETARKVAAGESSVLIRGASGTGKELLAQVLHDNSPRRSGPLIRVHCAALSASLLESELFGHVKGAFTGAHRDRIGRFEMANGGTLFLDEIGDISLETQIKLLRVLQTRSFEPVGGTRTINVDVRLITATHQDLKQLIKDGRFREDLYYRLNVITISLPSLKERSEDILELAMHFLVRSSRRLGKRLIQIDEDAMNVLKKHDWPGNIRELENVIERAVVLADGDRVRLHDLPPEMLEGGSPLTLTKPTSRRHVVPSRATPTETQPSASPDHVAKSNCTTEINRLREALQQCGGNKAEAARLLGMPRSTYYSKLKKYQIS